MDKPATVWDSPLFVSEWNSLYGLKMENTVRPSLVFPLMKEKIGDFTNRNLLDLGCGNGNLVRVFQHEAFQSWLGVDGGSAVLESTIDLKDDPRCRFILTDITTPMDIEHQSIDDLISIFVMEEIPLASLPGLFSNIKSCLKDDGQAHIFINHPAYAMMFDLDACREKKPNEKFENHLGYFDRTQTYFALTALNQTAGNLIKPRYYHKTMADFINAAAAADLHVAEIIETPKSVIRWENLAAYQPISGDYPRFLYMRLKHN